MSERKSVLLRLDPAVHDALAKWAADEMRSTNAQIEFLLRRALAEGRPSARPLARRPAAATRAGPGRPGPRTPDARTSDATDARTPLRRNRRATLDSTDLNTHGSSG